jgi:hypothetical protein
LINLIKYIFLMKFTKSIVLAALVGTITFSEVQSITLGHKQRIEPGSIAQIEEPVVAAAPAPALKPVIKKVAPVALEAPGLV